jgi:hypothetical protein
LLKIEIPLLREECCQIQKIGASASFVLAKFLKIEVIATSSPVLMPLWLILYKRLK